MDSTTILSIRYDELSSPSPSFHCLLRSPDRLPAQTPLANHGRIRHVTRTDCGGKQAAPHFEAALSILGHGSGFSTVGRTMTRQWQSNGWGRACKIRHGDILGAQPRHRTKLDVKRSP